MQPKNQNEKANQIHGNNCILVTSATKCCPTPAQASLTPSLPALHPAHTATPYPVPAFHPVILATVGHAVVPAVGVAAPAKNNKAQTRGR